MVLSYGVLEVGVLKFFKKSIRVVANRAYNSHTTPIFKELGILKINDLYQVQLYKLHYRNINNLLPAYFRTFSKFLTLYGHQNYNLRNSHFRLPTTKRDIFVQSTKYQYLKLMRENNQSDLDRRLQYQYSYLLIILNPLSLINTILYAIFLTAIYVRILN